MQIAVRTIIEVPVAAMFPSPLNPRRRRDGLKNLSQSMEEAGVIHPLVGRWVPNRRFEVICGTRRHAAAQLAIDEGRIPQGATLPAEVRNISDCEAVILAAQENLPRADLTPLEEAELFQSLKPYLRASKRGKRQRAEPAIAAMLHIGERTVFRRLALLRLAPRLKEALISGAMTLQQAEAFVASSRSPQRQAEVFDTMRGSGMAWTAKEIRRRVSGTLTAAIPSNDHSSISAFGLTVAAIGCITREEAEHLSRFFADLSNGLPAGAVISSACSPNEITAAWKRTNG